MNAPYIVVDESLETPPYRQIVDQLASAIERGELKPGAPLPTVRQLAGDLVVAPNTVARAYTELQDAGWLVSDGRRGTRVADGAPKRNRNERARALKETVAKFVESLRQRGFTPQEVAVALRQAQGDT